MKYQIVPVCVFSFSSIHKCLSAFYIIKHNIMCCNKLLVSQLSVPIAVVVLFLSHYPLLLSLFRTPIINLTDLLFLKCMSGS